MSRYQTRLAEVCSALNGEGVKYVVVGATAMQLWGSTRASRGVDILIDPAVENSRRVVAALTGVGFGFAPEWTAEEVAEKKVTIIGDSPRVDILTVAWSVHYKHAAPEATVFTVEGVEIPTASLDHLIASKRTNRVQDAADIEVLQEIKRLRGG